MFDTSFMARVLLVFSPIVCDKLSFLRIEVEACKLKENIENMKARNQDGNVNSPKETTAEEIEVSFHFLKNA